MATIIRPYPELEVKLDLSGFDRLSAAIEGAITRALDTAADAIVAEAKERAPVRTGFMRDSTVIEDAELPDKRTIHAEAPYSGFLDLGTAKMAARPWFTPAVETGRETLAQAVENEVRKVTGG